MPKRIDRQRARAMLDELNFDPIRHLVAVARNPNTPLDLQVDACRFMLPFAHPRLADLELKIENEAAQPVRVSIINLMKDPQKRALIESASIALDVEQRRLDQAAEARDRLLAKGEYRD